MQCKKCGNHVENTVNFCPTCGEKFMTAKTGDGKLNLESHVNQVMEEALKIALRGNREPSGLAFLRQVPVYIWYIFLFFLCLVYYYFF